MHIIRYLILAWGIFAPLNVQGSMSITYSWEDSENDILISVEGKELDIRSIKLKPKKMFKGAKDIFGNNSPNEKTVTTTNGKSVWYFNKEQMNFTGAANLRENWKIGVLYNRNDYKEFNFLEDGNFQERASKSFLNFSSKIIILICSVFINIFVLYPFWKFLKAINKGNCDSIKFQEVLRDLNSHSSEEEWIGILSNMNESENIYFDGLREFKESMIRVDHDLMHTQSTEDFINFENIKNTHLINIDHIPSWATTIGVLGTFVGLTFGVADLQTSDSDLLLIGIDTLLSGIGSAFLTSIIGLILALAISIVQRYKENQLAHKIALVQDKMDRIFKRISVQEVIICENQKFLECLRSEDEFESTSLIETNKSIENTLRQQTKTHEANQALMSKLVASFGDEFMERIAEAVSRPLVNLAEKFEEGFDKMSQHNVNGASEITAKITEELQGSFKEFGELVKGFSTISSQIEGSLAGVIKSLSTHVDSFKGSIDSNEEYVRNMHNLVSQQNEATCNILATNQSQTSSINAVKDIIQNQERLVNSSLETAQRLGASYDEMERSLTKVANLSTSWEARISEMMKSTEIALSNYQTLISHTSEITNKMTSISESQNSSSQNLIDVSRNLSDSIESSTEKIYSNTSTIADSVINLSSIFESIHNSMTEGSKNSIKFIHDLDQGIQSLRSGQDRFHSNIEEYKNELKTQNEKMKRDITKVFEIMDKGVANLSNNLEKALDPCADSALRLRDEIENLSDLLSKRSA